MLTNFNHKFPFIALFCWSTTWFSFKFTKISLKIDKKSLYFGASRLIWIVLIVRSLRTYAHNVRPMIASASGLDFDVSIGFGYPYLPGKWVFNVFFITWSAWLRTTFQSSIWLFQSLSMFLFLTHYFLANFNELLWLWWFFLERMSTENDSVSIESKRIQIHKTQHIVYLTFRV